jgi:sugar phosphate isomerase/epimerase
VPQRYLFKKFLMGKKRISYIDINVIMLLKKKLNFSYIFIQLYHKMIKLPHNNKGGTSMEIGVSLNYNELGKYPSVYQDTGIMPKHIQVNGLTSEMSKIIGPLSDNIRNLRSINPEITISFHAFKFNLSEKVDMVRKVWLELAKETIYFAVDLDVKFVNFHAGYGSGGTRVKHQAYREALIPVLKELVDTASPYGLEIHLENLYPRPIHSEMRMLGDRTSDFNSFFSQISSPLFKLCYDYGHGNIDEHGIDIIREFSNRLGSIHAHDNDQLNDTHWSVGDTEKGTIDWKNEFDFLKSINYSGPFILESSIENQLKSLEYIKNANVQNY